MLDFDDDQDIVVDEYEIARNKMAALLSYGYLLVTSSDCFDTDTRIAARLEDLFNQIESELAIQRSTKGVKVVSFQRVEEPAK